MDVLLSIKPKYIKEIKNGNKKYEFRKSVFKEKVDKVFIYSSSPVKKIIGYFLVKEIIEASPEDLWEQCKNSSSSTPE